MSYKCRQLSTLMCFNTVESAEWITVRTDRNPASSNNYQKFTVEKPKLTWSNYDTIDGLHTNQKSGIGRNVSVENDVVWLSGVGCWQSDEPPASGTVDRFEDTSEPGHMWHRVYGGSLGTGCGQVGTGNSLYFDGPGTREARTVPFDLRHIK